MIAPQRQHHVRHHHHQRGALGNLLIEPEQHAQQRNGDQAAADAKQTAERAQRSAEHQIHQELNHSIFPVAVRPLILRSCFWHGNA
ncbi:hypothetical protein D3C78_928000 [compost metagenome]